MRTNIVHIGASELTYEIRQIVDSAHKLHQMTGEPTYWENIGDPVEKGEKIPDFIKDIIAQAVREDSTYAYCPTRGLLGTREFLANMRNGEGGVQIQPDDIIFFNGLGDAINKVYGMLRREARVIGPSPSYPTHSSAEAAHAGYPPITYRLDPRNNWMPDIDELYNKVKYNESIAGIMIINPDNPTGAVYPPEIVKEMIDIARKFDLFIIADEIYMNMVYNNTPFQPISQLIGDDVPAIVLKGISKEMPWPGSRCGWMEVYNQKDRHMFQTYVKSILNAKMLEVCSTTLPQTVIPRIFSHPEWKNWGETRNKFFERRSRMIGEIFADCPGVIVNPPNGAFYISVVFDEELTDEMSMRIEPATTREYIDELCPPGSSPDKRFVYQLLATRNVCTVPLSGFVTELQGFRCTLLEQNDIRFDFIYTSVADAIKEFLSSGVVKV